jgi:hypothetical protein
MAAAEMVGRLLERYALTMEEIDLRESPLRPGRDPPSRPAAPPHRRLRARYCPLLRLQGLAGPRRRGATLCLFRLRDGYRAGRLPVPGGGPRHGGGAGSSSALRAPGHCAGVPLRQASTSFQQGMAARLAERLEVMHAEREAGVAAQRQAGTALMLVKHRVVEDAFRETGTRLVSGGSRRSLRQDAAFRQGEAAGERVNLNRPVSGDGRRPAGMKPATTSGPASMPGRMRTWRPMARTCCLSPRRSRWWRPSGPRWACATPRPSSPCRRQARRLHADANRLRLRLPPRLAQLAAAA